MYCIVFCIFIYSGEVGGGYLFPGHFVRIKGFPGSREDLSQCMTSDTNTNTNTNTKNTMTSNTNYIH